MVFKLQRTLIFNPLTRFTVTAWVLGILKALLCLLGTVILVACGGGGSDSGTKNTHSTGVLIDAPVAGVSYLTSTGVSGVTAADGSYSFNAGDSVEFKLGSLVLGNVTATAIVTPIELANGNGNQLTNLLVTLQSLDADGSPPNGISIPAPAAAAVTSSIDLSVAPSSYNKAALQAAMTAGGIATPIVSEADANSSFLAQFTTVVGSNIWVSQPATNVTGSTFMLRIGANGEYLQGQVGAPEPGGMAGTEQGTASASLVDVHGFKLAASPTVDTNGEWGLSHVLPCDRIRSIGNQLISTFGVLSGSTCTQNTLATISKAENNPAGIVGVWAIGSATNVNTAHAVFFSNGKFLLVDPQGDAFLENPSCGGPGVESGAYTYSGSELTLSNFAFNTNGCAGFVDKLSTEKWIFTIAADGKTATTPSDGEPPVTFYRVSK